MRDYEYLFSTNLHAKLKERIIGKIFCKVDEDDRLCVSIDNNFRYHWVDSDFSEKLIYGYSVDDVARAVIADYRKFVSIHYFK